MQVTFGKSKKSSINHDNRNNTHSYSSGSNTKNESSKLISTMLKELDNNNKFMVGNKKIELRYEGEKKDRQRHGNGTLYFSNGLCFEGEFRKNIRNGYGILKFNHI
eukprot:GHVR01080458.1.p1 GENE.GHVR01080458.1~~GHVR01080458.1.p1  ORF type:complete len:106 (-),score=9.67 GHVR01080458.1:5061-5378(-)